MIPKKKKFDCLKCREEVICFLKLSQIVLLTIYNGLVCLWTILRNLKNHFLPVPPLIYVPGPKGKNRNPTGRPNDSPVVRQLWDAHSDNDVVVAQTDGQMQQGHRDVLTTEKCITGAEIGVNGVQIVWEGGGRAGVGGVTVQIPGLSPGPSRLRLTVVMDNH